MLNARVDTFLGGAVARRRAIERGNAYLDAGARTLPILASDRDDLSALVVGIRGPIAAIVTPSLRRRPARATRRGAADGGAGLAAVALRAAADEAARALQPVT